MTGQVLQRKQAALVKSLLELSIPAQFVSASGALITVPIKAKTFLRHLVRKLWPVLLAGGCRLTGSCAGLVALGQRSRRIGDIDVTILVSDEVDLGQVFFHEQNILRELAGLPGKELEAQLLDSIRVSNETDCWSLFSFGKVGCPGARHLDVRVAKRMSRSYVFSCDSLEVVIDPLLVQGVAEQRMLLFSRWGDCAEALDDLRAKRLVMPEPQTVRGGLLRYCLALCRGFQMPDADQRASVERALVANFMSEFKSPDHVKNTIRRTALRHSDGANEASLREQLTSVISRTLPTLL